MRIEDQLAVAWRLMPLQSVQTHSAVPSIGRSAPFKSWCEMIRCSRQKGQVAIAKKSGTWVIFGGTGLQTMATSFHEFLRLCDEQTGQSAKQS